MEENNPTQTPPQFTPNNSVSTQPKKFNRKFLVLAGLIVLAGFVIAGSKTSIVEMDTKELGKTEQKENFASNWTTYTNTEYGFEIKHPTGWWPVQQRENLVVIYGPDADLSSIGINYYPNINSLPLNPTTNKPYEYFDQYVMDSRLFSNQKNIPLGSGVAKSASLVQDPSYKVLLVGGNGHFYEISYMPRYDQTLPQLEQIISTFKFVQPTTDTSTVNVVDVLPSGAIFFQGEGADIPVSWKINGSPTNATIYLRLLSADGSEVLGSISNKYDCSAGGDASALPISTNMYKWDGLTICSNWQAHKVSPGSYRIGVQVYYGNNMIASGNSDSPFMIK